MKILYVGDVMGELGIEVVGKILLKLRKEKQIDLVIAQAENTTNGKGLSQADFTRLKKIGIDSCSGGNWRMMQEDILPALNDPSQQIIRPANYPAGNPRLVYNNI